MAKQRLRGTYVFPARGASQANVDKTISEATEEIKSVVYKSVAGLEVESNKTASVDHNGTVVVTPSDGKDAMEKATVTVAVPLESNKTVSITQNGTTLVQPSTGKDGMEKVTVNVNVSGGGADLEDNKTATIDVSAYTEPVEITPTTGKDGMKKATVTLSNIPSGGDVESNKAVTIDVSSYTAPIEVTPTAGKDSMAKATVTLSNIPSGGSVTLFVYRKDPQYGTTSVALIDHKPTTVGESIKNYTFLTDSNPNLEPSTVASITENGFTSTNSWGTHTFTYLGTAVFPIS